MTTHVETLYKKRQAILDQMTSLDSFRRGAVSAIYRKCGKPQCWCSKAGERGHGPQYIWSATIKWKSVAKNLQLGPEVEKYLHETESHKKFLELCEELVEVNEQLCEARPVRQLESEEELQALKKKLQKFFMTRRAQK